MAFALAATSVGCAVEGRRLVGVRDAAGPSMDAGSEVETCYNGLDDNGDGLIDERCPCTGGERQSCWPGAASRREVGACRDGVQTCEPFGEFEAWGDCLGASLPREEIRANGIDEDCDGTDGMGIQCRSRETEGGGCADGRDDDCDGLSDCLDPDCASTDECRSECTVSEGSGTCGDSIDNDCDSRVDCLDPDCQEVEPCRIEDPDPSCTPVFPFFVEIVCGDGGDNDCDGATDCADMDCRFPGSCGCPLNETLCGDGVDGDCDRDTDCQDIDCQECTEGSYRYCDESSDSQWGRQDCVEGRWGRCVSTSSTPSGCGSGVFSASCCVEAGECCANYPSNNESVGAGCEGRVSCRP